jgi:hypothetical protein
MKLVNAFRFFGTFSVVSALVPRQYQARYHNPEGFNEIDDEYIVLLYPNHTLSAHFQAIGIDLEHDKNTKSFHPLDLINGYAAVLDNHTLHNIVRLDPGVEVVEHNVEIPGLYPTETFNKSTVLADDIPNVRKRWEKTRVASAYWHDVHTTNGEKKPFTDVGDYVSIAAQSYVI